MRKILFLLIASFFVCGLAMADSTYTYENVTILGPLMAGAGETPAVEAIRITTGSQDAAIAVGDVMAWGIQPQYTDGEALGLMVERCARDSYNAAVSTSTYGYGPYAGVMITITTSGDTSKTSGAGWSNSEPLRPSTALGFMAIRGFVDAKIDVSNAAVGEHLITNGATLDGSFATAETAVGTEVDISEDIGVLLELPSSDGLGKVWLR